MKGISLVEDEGGVSVRIPMKMKKRGGRKEILVPESLDVTIQKTCYGNAFAIALARAHCWLELLDSGRYRSIREMADAMGLCHTYVTRLLRFTLLAPDIIQTILDGRELDGFSQNKLVGAIPADWEEQRQKWGFSESESSLLQRVLSQQPGETDFRPSAGCNQPPHRIPEILCHCG